MRMNHRSLAFRLGAWYTLLLSVAFALVGAGTLYGLDHSLRSSLRDSLRRRSGQIQIILSRLPADATGAAIEREIATRIAPEINNRFVRITRAGSVVYRSGAPADHSFDPSAVPSGPWVQAPGSPSITQLPRGGRLMMIARPADTPSGRYLVEVGVSAEPIEAALERMLALLAMLVPALIVCAAGGGYLLVGRALRPVDRLSQTAEQMSLQDLSFRLPVEPSGDALERLAISFNNMLSRLRDSVQTSRRFLADASHELRTPLTIVKGELQELSSGAATLTGEELEERVGSVLEEVARLEHLVSGLLVLSRLDAGETQQKWVAVDLSELARSTAEQMRLLAEDRGIEINLSELGAAQVRGDRSRLKQVIVNLLDNAIRFTPRGGRVSLRTSTSAGACVLELADTGAGIPAAALPHVFDRFFRVDEARSRDDGGAGLGLSIVKSICSMHGAELDVESELARGSTFRVRFPAYPAARIGYS